MAAIVWTPQAADDFEAACRYLARDSHRYAASFAGRVGVAVERLERFPESGRVVPEFGRPEIRELIVQRYRVIYRLIADRVEILTIVHGARRLPPMGPDESAREP
ncbi:MAG TPA: type II toxin-antitoxin system RelE/ParE family toxin [Dehalococcoidia bacterium]|nr:type II toxin-antitoxin system RelE/ParE family toxin [Dehalococcoidia bacterium]